MIHVSVQEIIPGERIIQVIDDTTGSGLSFREDEHPDLAKQVFAQVEAQEKAAREAAELSAKDEAARQEAAEQSQRAKLKKAKE